MNIQLPLSVLAVAPNLGSVRKEIIIDAVFGTYRLLRGHYLAVVTRSRKVADGPSNSSIFSASEMEFVPVPSNTRISLNSAEEREESTYLTLLQSIAKTNSFYFASGYDLTNSLQRNDRISAEVENPDLSHCDEMFFWNGKASTDIVACGPEAASFITPFINGFVGSGPCEDLGNSVMLLISRRSVNRQGTRFNVRGADLNGNVANFVETEQILFGAQVSSFVQIRGSVPVLWQQHVTMKYTPRCQISSDDSSIRNTVYKHYKFLTGKYGRVTSVNLIDKKKDQLSLGSAFQSYLQTVLVRDMDPESVPYVWFDFHSECGKAGWTALSKLLNEVVDKLDQDSFYQRSPDGTGAPSSFQKGVMRVNCMDNLDRTNVVQSIFARHAALVATPGALEMRRKTGGTVLTSPFPLFDRTFNNLWADNADAISRLYAGTGALKTDFTRTGKRTFAGMLADGVNSLTRYFLNNLSDGRRQDAWDLFLCNYLPERHNSTSKTLTVSKFNNHVSGASIGGFALGTTVFFASLVSIFAYTLGSITAWENVNSWSISAASVVFLGLSYNVLSKGNPAFLGKMLVSKPAFVPLRPFENVVVPSNPKSVETFGAGATSEDLLDRSNAKRA